MFRRVPARSDHGTEVFRHDEPPAGAVASRTRSARPSQVPVWRRPPPGAALILARPSTVPARSVPDVLRGSGQPLAAELRTEMEARLGADLSDVRLHTDGAARASAAAIGARAYTSGSHIVIGDGGADRHTLAHELTHVLQQRQGPVAGTDHGDGFKVSDPSDVHERAAEANARRVMAGATTSAPSAAGPPGDRRPAAEPATQRAIIVGTDTYGPGNKTIVALFNDAVFQTELAKLDVNTQKAVKARLGQAFGSKNNISANSIAELVQTVAANLSLGKQLQQAGEQLEQDAAATVGGAVPRGGSNPPGWAVQYTDTFANRDPNVYDKTNTGQRGTYVVKPDVWSDSGLGIVGGEGKHKDQSMFVSICTNLKQVCDSHGKEAWVFFARNAKDPSKLADLKTWAIQAGIAAADIRYADDGLPM